MQSRRVFLKNGAFAFVSLGFAPSFMARTAVAASGRSKQLIAIFQRGAVDGLSVVVPYGEGDYYRARPSIAIPRPEQRRRRRDRPRRLFRLQPAAAAAQAALGLEAAGHRPRLRIARQHALALRRAGLHGERDARREEHVRRLAESLPPGAAGRAPDAVPRRGADLAAAADAAGHGPGARRQPARAVRHPRRPVERGGRRVVRSRVRRGRRRGVERHGPRRVQRDQDAQDRRPVEVRAGQRRRLPAQPVRPVAAPDRAAHEGERRPRGRLRRRRRLGHAREPGQRPGTARRTPRRLLALDRRAGRATSATAWRTPWC